MSSCQRLDRRDRARAAVARLSSRPEVVGCDIVTPEVDPTDRWTVEATIDCESAVPPQVIEEVAAAGLAIRELAPRAEWYTVVAVVEST